MVMKLRKPLAALAAGIALCLALAAPAVNAAPALNDSGDLGWAQQGGDLFLSGTECLGEGAWVAIIGDGVSQQVTPDASGDWSINLATALPAGNYAATVTCYAYADVAPLITPFAEMTNDPDDPKWTPSFEYEPVQFAITDLTSAPGRFIVGEDVPVTFGGFLPNETVTLWLSGGSLTDPIKVGEGVADADGNVSTTFNIPESVEKGEYRLIALGETSERYVSLTVTIGIEDEVVTPPAEGGMPPLGLDV